jgi:hypothetical protein
MAATPSVKSSCNWWLQDNDVFAVTDLKNHTPNGKRSLCFKSGSTLEKLKMACGTFNQNGLVEMHYLNILMLFDVIFLFIFFVLKDV